MLGELAKGAADILSYTFNWTSWLNGDTIASSTWTVPAGVTKVSSANTTTTTTVKLAGGTVGTSYTITNTIVTNTGTETKVETFTLRLE